MGFSLWQAVGTGRLHFGQNPDRRLSRSVFVNFRHLRCARVFFPSSRQKSHGFPWMAPLFIIFVFADWFFFVRQQIKYPLVLCSSNFLAFFSERFWYCRLSPNLKFLHYGDCQEGEAPPLENLPNKCEYVLQGRGIELSRLLYCPCAALKVFIKKNEIFGQAIFLARLTLPYTMFERFLALKVNPKPKTTTVRQHVWPLRSVLL